MQGKKKKHPEIKTKLHPRNKHRERYDFEMLIKSCPELASYVQLNKYGDLSIDFFIPEAVKMLNKALLLHYYEVNWDIPAQYLCPPIPGRADYIHHVADLLHGTNSALSESKNKNIRCLDIGVGANCVYPIIGSKEYGWQFVGSDVDAVSVAAATKIVEGNAFLKKQVTIRLQPNGRDVFKGIIKPKEFFDLTICNPPFHSSLEDAQKGSLRKLKNLKSDKASKSVLNFGGQNNELWCVGGEVKFVRDMIYESKHFSKSCRWFTTLVSKESHLKAIYKVLRKVDAVAVKTIAMGQGNKISRIVAWTFLEPKEQEEWLKK